MSQAAPSAPQAALARSCGVFISIAEPGELAFWAMLFHVDPAVLEVVIGRVGTDLVAIEDALGGAGRLNPA